MTPETSATPATPVLPGPGKTGPGTFASRLAGLLLISASLLLTWVIMDGIDRSIRGPDDSARLRAERRQYYERVILPAGLQPREALFYEVLR